MSETRKFANAALYSFLKEYGFKKRGSVWTLLKREFLLSIDLQKSQWSDIYYVNVGVQFGDLDGKLPKAHKGDIKYRVVDSGGSKSRGSFNLDIELPLIQQLIKEQVVNLFAVLDTKEQIKDVIIKNPTRYIVTLNGKQALGLI